MDDAMSGGLAAPAAVEGAASWEARARAVLPAGGFGNFDAGVMVREGRGARVWTEDGAELVDLLIGSGPMILGHGHPEVLEAVAEQLSRGLTFFATNARGVELAEEIVAAMACAEQARFVSTGGEADMYAMRLARAHTGRTKILKFEGGYHGMTAEALMSLAPHKRMNFPLAEPDSAGIPESVRDEILVAPFNDAETARQLMDAHDGEIAAVIVEPFQRIIPPAPGFLEALRAETAQRGILLIFDEVVTGFRFAYGGAQEVYGVVPDLCTLGKIVGGGFPLAAVAGGRDVMAHFDKAAVGAERFTLQMGTLSGNPVAAVAGLKTLEILRRPGFYAAFHAKGRAIMESFSAALSGPGVAHQIVGHPTLFDVVFLDRPVRDYRDTLDGDAARAKAWNRGLRAGGILKPDSKAYVSAALTDADLAQIADAATASAATLG